MVIGALFIIVKKLKLHVFPPTNKYMNMWYINNIEYYLAIKKNEILTHATHDEP